MERSSAVILTDWLVLCYVRCDHEYLHVQVFVLLHVLYMTSMCTCVCVCVSHGPEGVWLDRVRNLTDFTLDNIYCVSLVIFQASLIVKCLSISKQANIYA